MTRTGRPADTGVRVPGGHVNAKRCTYDFRRNPLVVYVLFTLRCTYTKDEGDQMTSTDTTKCRRCSRPLTSLSSRLAEIGPRCAAIEAALGDLTADQQDKALEVITDGGVVETGRKGVYRVEASKGDTAYLVHVESGSCNCAWGLRRKSATVKVCHHAGAARLKARPVIRRTVRRSQFAKAS